MKDFIEFSNENNVKVINLDPIFNKLKSKKIHYNDWPITKKKGHFNERGHQEIAKFPHENINEIKNLY